jgi:ribonuclease HI
MGKLMDVHFPGSTQAVKHIELAPSNDDHIYCDIDDEEVAFITPQVIKRSIASFGDHKAAGIDELKPIALKHLGTKALQRLVSIYRASVLLGYTPVCWRVSKVIFIPKVGKDDYAEARSFRPISLSSFLLKALERVWLWRLNETTLKDNPLSDTQHAFRKGYSTDSALSNMVEHLESGVMNEGFAMAVFLDIQGAFDNIPLKAITNSLKKKGVPEIFINWYSSLLANRTAETEHLGVKIARRLKTGTSQGGVLSPPIWNIVFDSFLDLFKAGRVQAVGFADDAGLVAKSQFPEHLTLYLQDAVNKALEWGRQNELQFSAPKTVCVLFTNKRKYKTPKPISMDGVSIPFSDTARYLGVTLDSQLTWKPHLKNKIRVAKGKLMRAKMAMGKLWGIPPKSMRWLYLGIVRPALIYGSLVWARACKNAWAQKELSRVNRLALLSMGHFRKATPTAGLEIITHVPPLDLQIQFEAAMAYRRTKDHRKTSPALLCTKVARKVGHRQKCREFLHQLDPEGEKVDDIPAVIIWDKSYRVDTQTFNKGMPGKFLDVDVYTDGSVHNKCAGAGLVVYIKGKEFLAQSINLGPQISAFQAEIYAIKRAAELITMNWPHKRTCKLYTDSQAAMLALDKANVSSSLILNCMGALNSASETSSLTVRWVKAHAGHLGNERADALAKEGARNIALRARDCPSIPDSIVKTRLKARFEEMWKDIWEARVDCRQTKQWFPEPNKKVSFQLIRLDRRDFSTAVQLITGHNFMMRHQWKLGETSSPTCRLCEGGDDDDEESTFHVVAECPALAAKRLKHFGTHCLQQPLIWTHKMTAFLREESIGLLLNQGDPENLDPGASRVSSSTRDLS